MVLVQNTESVSVALGFDVSFESETMYVIAKKQTQVNTVNNIPNKIDCKTGM
ncbi:MAG: hypothetical protein IJZ42_13525 [Lachnospiraceae bacterium]|nr:hypothetical protein [Lachnospiraceae bacterium]